MGFRRVSRFLRLVLVSLLAFVYNTHSFQTLHEPETKPGTDLETTTSGLEEAARVFAFVPSVWDFITEPNNSAFFVQLVGFQWFFVVSMYPIFALVTWDQKDTRVGEEANFIRVYNFFTNPSNAMNAITFLFGHWVGASILFALPTLLWTGAPLPEKPASGKSDDFDDLNQILQRTDESGGSLEDDRLNEISDRKDYNGEELEDGDDDGKSPEDRLGKGISNKIVTRYYEAWRRLISPNGIARVMIFISIVHLGAISFWLCAPFLKGPSNFFGTARSTRSVRINKIERSNLRLRHSQSFIWKSISTEPKLFKDRSTFEVR